jgi:hypothetical protein
VGQFLLLQEQKKDIIIPTSFLSLLLFLLCLDDNLSLSITVSHNDGCRISPQLSLKHAVVLAKNLVHFEEMINAL